MMQPSLRDPAFLGALVHFERVAARLSFVKAAADLGVTASAVSHRISALEGSLGHRLFERSPRNVSLTREGAELAAAVRESLAGLRHGVEGLAGRRVLRVSVGPFLSANWLMSRLADFEARHSGLRIDLMHRMGWPDLKDVDLAIVWRESLPAGVAGDLLFAPECVAVATPGALGEGPIWAQGLPPLHYRDRTLWRQWLEETRGPRDFAEHGEVFEDPNLVLEAAAHGRGIAMGFLPFVSHQIAAGRLSRVHPVSLPSRQRYWLVPGAGGSPELDDFIAWLTDEVAEMGRGTA